jgi:hypothetical protein
MAIMSLCYRGGGLLASVNPLRHSLWVPPRKPLLAQKITPPVSWKRSTSVFSSLQRLRNLSVESTPRISLFQRPCLRPLVENIGGIRTFQHMARHSERPASSSATSSSSTSRNENTKSKLEPTAAEQRRTDWTIVKRLMINVWPRNDWKTRLTVVFGFLLLVTAKVMQLLCLTINHMWTFF